MPKFGETVPCGKHRELAPKTRGDAVWVLIYIRERQRVCNVT